MLFSKQEIILRITFHYNKGHNKKQAIGIYNVKKRSVKDVWALAC